MITKVEVLVMMTKEMIYEEFNIKTKTLRKRKTITLTQLHICKDVLTLRHPNQYRHLDINFDNLIVMYQSGDPEMYMYKKHGMNHIGWNNKEKKEEKAKRKSE